MISLKEKKMYLENQMLNLSTDETWETLSREQLNMVKPGETVYRFYYKEDQ